MKYLIVGLGNIGPEYSETRHNIGFMVADYLVDKLGGSFDIDRHAYKAEVKHKGRTIVVIKPTTYMNLSGKALQHWKNSLQIPTENILVIVDDLALPFGSIRIKGQGSSAGHNGLKSIEALLGNANYPRLRMGIGSDYPKGRQVDFVLGKFSEDEKAGLGTFIQKTHEAILEFCSAGITHAMNKFNS